MVKRILVMGLPGSGKTMLASKIAPKLMAKWLNADEVRAQADDWDFSPEGRLRQAKRMRTKCDEGGFNYAIADFVAPTPEIRELFDAHYTIWVDTIPAGRFEDTNKVFVPPEK